jgi:hypothetical protein
MKHAFSPVASVCSAVLAAGLFFGAYPSANADTSVAATAASSTAAMEAESRQVAQDLLKQLGGTLKAQIAASGPESAVPVCRDVAPKLAGQASLAKGWKVARVGTRTRNSLLGMPDAWEQEVLARFQQRLAAGEKLDSMEFSQVVQEPAGGNSFRYMKAIGMQQQCVACHGPQDQIAPGMKVMLDQNYPHDQATGYTPGQLRGAVTIKRPI